MKTSTLLAVAAGAALTLVSCSTTRKIRTIRRSLPSAELSLPSRPAPKIEIMDQNPDTMRVIDSEGHEYIIMNAIFDEQSGEMVATEQLNAACVVARFKNVAERHGEVDLEFQLIVSDTLQDTHWQVRFQPTLIIEKDSVDLDPVYITGEDFRKAQLRGYRIYGKYLESISRDSLYFIDRHQMNTLLTRANHEVGDEEARLHYTRGMMVWINSMRIGEMSRKERKYLRNPINPDTVRIDSVRKPSHFIYTYVQTIKTRPGLRKADVVLKGGIFDESKRIYTIPESSPITFYISSISSFLDPSPHYRDIVVERQVKESQKCDIAFVTGKSEIDTTLGSNAAELSKVKKSLTSLLADESLILDSIVVTASCSPDGRYAVNSRLASERAAALRTYVTKVMGGGNKVRMICRHIPENWEKLEAAVRESEYLKPSEKAAYRRAARIADPDSRENALAAQPFNRYLRDIIYPSLRFVSVEEHLHRKDMVKDTIHTTIIDTVYMEGVKALQDREYEKAIEILRPYADYNTAIAYLALDYNSSALQILQRLPQSAEIEYMLALVHARKGHDRDAVRYFLKSCEKEPQYKYRGNLDPEIAAIIKKYRLEDYFSSVEAASFL